jgi:ankyrin repeat protein
MHEVDEYGRSQLHYSALENDLESAEARVRAGDDPNLRDVHGFTPLHFAAQEGAADVARFLLSAGAEVDSTDELGNTPLMKAVFESRGRGDLIELLRAGGADPLKSNARGQTPAGLARLIGNYDVAQFFTDLPDQS